MRCEACQYDLPEAWVVGNPQEEATRASRGRQLATVQQIVEKVKGGYGLAEEPVQKSLGFDDVQLGEEDQRTLREILAGHETERAALVSILQDVNAHYRYLPEDVLRHVARAVDMPLSHVFSIATFYNSFSLTPRGKHVVRVCMGTACHVKGGHRILQALERILKVETGGTTEDKNFSLEEVRCLGCCGLAPVITVNEDLYGSVTQARLPKILEQYQEEGVAVGATVGGTSDG